jgi:hypothetical protein
MSGSCYITTLGFIVDGYVLLKIKCKKVLFEMKIRISQKVIRLKELKPKQILSYQKIWLPL